jgi:hypothetical protein
MLVSARTAADAYQDNALQWQSVGQFPARLAQWKKTAYLQSSSRVARATGSMFATAQMLT